ncbi:Catabolite control protein B (plasmid) [Pediococcus acidilactici]|nr:Catabolite control protein B [Pediococcus acidilactici]
MPHQLSIKSVYNDRLQTFTKLFEKLKDVGQTHIGLILARPASHSHSTKEVLAAYDEVFGETISSNVVRYHGKTFADGIWEAKQLVQIDNHLQVVLTEGDTTAAGAYSEYQKSGLDVTVIGQENELPSKLLGFSTIDYHLEEVGRQSVALLEEDVRSVAVPVEIVERKSGDEPRVMRNRS